MITPYYQDETVTIYYGNCLEVCSSLPMVNAIFTDPPFAQETHEGARTGSADRMLVDFDSITSNQLLGYMQLCRSVCDKWIVSFVDWRHMLALETQATDLELVRFGVWVKPNGMPQYSGDRPATGWEAIAFLHPKGKKVWNGGGRTSVFNCNFEQKDRVHPTQKPIRLLGELISLFSNHNDLILDPFVGAGSTLVAAKQLRRRAIGIEIEEKYCEIAAKRCEMVQPSFFDTPIERESQEGMFQ